MPLVTLDRASLAFGDAPLLDAAVYSLDAGERVALIGRNGSGKTSLLKVLAGEQPLDDGIVWRAPGARIAYVAQEPALDSRHSIYEAVAVGLGEVREIMIAYHNLSHALSHSSTPADLNRLHELQHALEHADAWRLSSRIDAAIDRLHLPPDAIIAELSGGQPKRVALAQALVLEPEVLLLDEPTNHLDIEAIEWLQELLKGHAGALMFVTHDRRFLDEVATRVVELDRGKLSSFAGTYSEYRRRKDEMLHAESVANARFDKLLAQEEAWIRKGIEARRTRNEGRVRRLDALRIARSARRDRIGHVSFSLDSSERSGEMVVELNDVSKRFGDKVLISHFSTRIVRGDKIGLIGANGSGKSTLLKLILGELQADSGKIRHGTRLEVAYFDQMREQLDEEATLIDTISKGAEYIDTGAARKHVMSYLADFLFPPQRARAKVSALSGGERNRLLLARLFSRPANVLVLDEPTNDLDLETLELLEALLQEYSGTLFLVSHDRAFLDNVVTQVIAFEGNGALREYAGGYSDWQRQRAQAEPTARVRSTIEERRTAQSDRQRPARLSYNETRELAALPQAIAELEREQASITAELADPDVYRDEPARVEALRNRYSAIESELMQALERWEALESRDSK